MPLEQVATTCTAVGVPGGADRWRALGFDLLEVGGVHLQVGATGLGFIDTHGLDDIDGIPVWDSAPAATPRHPNGLTALDHVVITTGDAELTLGAFAAIGLVPRARRDLDERQQHFLVAGSCVFEVLSPTTPTVAPAIIWGLAFVSPDLEATARHLDLDPVGIRPAVQPGRHILTLPTERTGLPLVVMTPRTRTA